MHDLTVPLSSQVVFGHFDEAHFPILKLINFMLGCVFLGLPAEGFESSSTLRARPQARFGFGWVDFKMCLLTIMDYSFLMSRTRFLYLGLSSSS